MDVLSLIKKRKTIRRYEDRLVPAHVLSKIIRAGIWGPSLSGPGFQPWKFVVIKNKVLINKIAHILLNKSKKSRVGINVILHIGANTIRNSETIIVIYNTFPLVNFAKRIKQPIKYAKVTELCAISAAIQNMILVAESLGVGACWLSTPLFCSKKISEITNINDELIAILTLGYPAEEGRRASRRPISEIVKYVY